MYRAPAALGVNTKAMHKNNSSFPLLVLLCGAVYSGINSFLSSHWNPLTPDFFVGLGLALIGIGVIFSSSELVERLTQNKASQLHGIVQTRIPKFFQYVGCILVLSGVFLYIFI